jgi:hypothetical protein
MTEAEAASEAAASAQPLAPPLHLYLTGIQHHYRPVRVLGMGIMFQLMVLRSLALFKRQVPASPTVLTDPAVHQAAGVLLLIPC